MRDYPYTAGKYRNADGRWQWSVFCQVTCCHYFAKRHGSKAAIALSRRMNTEHARVRQ